jgi:hypothetical protein
MRQCEERSTSFGGFLCTVLLVALLGMTVGFLVHHVNLANRQRVAIQTLRERQSQLIYRRDIELGRQLQRNPSARHPFLFRLGEQILGRDFLDDVQIVMLRGRNVGDHDMTLVTQLKGVQRLYLTATSVTDVGLRELESIATLETVHLNFAPAVTESGIDRLRAAGVDVQIDALLTY